MNTDRPSHSGGQEGEGESSEIEEGEVERALDVLRKLKKIEKRGGLNRFKSKAKANNQLFHQMSEFFHQKHKRLLEAKNQVLRQRRVMSKRQFQSSVNSLNAPALDSADDQQEVEEGEEEEGEEAGKLPEGGRVKASCHICCLRYSEIHPFYGQLCPECAAFNWAKRHQRASMAGLTALVTGGRIKIGFEIALRLLREGARVFVTSRFPNDAELRYRREADYAEWKERLFVMQCDFLAQAQVAALVTHLQQAVEKLDILVNNAAQTLVRPQQFYALELRNEQLALEDSRRVDCRALQSAGRAAEALPSLYCSAVAGEIDLEEVDEFGQPRDRRTSNSWVQRVEEVPLVDCFTTQVVNAVVPFHLVGALRGKLTGRSPSWVLNVSSMEGVFYRANKQPFHPHTNMAKAALNMLTRTSAADFSAQGIFMNAVDTGWVTNENPYPVIKKMTEEHHFKCPLDCLDGAMRVLDPVYQGLLHKQFPYGQFLKNYKSSNW